MKFGIVHSKDLDLNDWSAEHYLDKKISCSLCGMEFSKYDVDIEKRKLRHEEWHTNCRSQKRNTTEGKVEWIG